MTATDSIRQHEPTSPVRLPSVSLVRVVLVLAVPLAVAFALMAMVVGGAFSTGTALYDPGPAVDLGLPIARVIHDAAATATVGLLVL
jgi:putative copper resistance protein D